MKKVLMLLAITLSTMVVFARDVEVSKKVLNAFKTEFATAQEVTWSAGANYYRAAFVFNGQHVSAFFNNDGELLGINRYISLLNLPMNLQASLKRSYSEYWITDLLEVTKSESTGYYITLENADTRIVLKAGADSDWYVYNKSKKI